MPVLRKIEAVSQHAAAHRTTRRIHDFEMEDSITRSARSEDGHGYGHADGQRQSKAFNTRRKGRLAGIAGHTLGLILLLFVVLLWTTCNFLGSSIFADATYAKPFFLTYLDTSMFILCMIPRLGQGAYKRKREGLLGETVRSAFTTETLRAFWHGKEQKEYRYIPADEEESFLKPDDTIPRGEGFAGSDHEETLGLLPTARYALTFALVWFSANYFAMSCLQYTTVASTTILTSTSSVWTLLIGALTRTEKFTWRKLCGVLASLAGVILISQIDLQARNQEAGGISRRSSASRRTINEFPDKSPYELALGDALALLSAVLYGLYTISLKKTTVAALPKSIHMPSFFGFVGLFNTIFLFPLFPVLHFSGLERFVLPPAARVWTILLMNAVSSLLSDICWAYGMVLTSPLVAAVALSLTIPFSLVGEMFIQGRSESWIYWLGASIVVGSFVFVEREEKSEGDDGDGAVEEDLGEPGPAIVVEDYDELILRRGRERSPSPLLLVTEDDEPEQEREIRY